MKQVDFQAAAERAKLVTRGISTRQIGPMKIEEKDRGCDLIIEYTKDACFVAGETAVLSLGIHFNTTGEAHHARNTLRYGSADLGMLSEKPARPRRDPSFDVSL